MFQLHYFFITIHHRIKYYNNVKMVELKQKNKNKKRTRRNSVYLFLIWSVKKMILRDIYAKNKQENDFAEKPNYILVLIFWQAFGQRRLTVKRVCSTWDSYRKPPRGGPKNKQQGGKGKKKKVKDAKVSWEKKRDRDRWSLWLGRPWKTHTVEKQWHIIRRSSLSLLYPLNRTKDGR